MGKSIRFNPKHAKDHAPSHEELEQQALKHKKPNKINLGELSDKQVHGHFSKMHIWPKTNTKRKGRRKV